MKNAVSGRTKTDLSALYDELEGKLRSLESLGRTQEKYGDFLTPLVESCLPEEILMAWERKRNTETDAKGSRTLEHLMTFLRLEVQGEEMVQLAKSGFGTPIRKKDSPTESVKPTELTTASALASSVKSSGAFNDLAKLDWHKISRETSTQKIVWKFIPPTAAWWGGWWERLVRIIKELLRRSLGKSILCYRFETLPKSQRGDCQVIYSQFGLAIHQNDHQARRRFVEWAQNEIAVVPDFHKRILFSDEAHFWLNGYVNKQNCRIWSEANPQVYVETPLHPEKLTVWCALWAGGILLQNDEGRNVTVNGDRYRAMITNFFIPELNNHDVQELWFQQDGATCHTARATIDLLKDTFGDRLISRFGPVNWPPRSCDLTSLDYFLWGYVKSLVYADKPQTLDHLEDNIGRVIADIRPQMLEKVIENWTSRLDYIRASRGSHMPEIIFIM
ncbi:transposable element Tc3 transposase [Trichonephila clavipes]|nr:transposable element Tc3 transposase [Trichonephila clavipes]